MLKFFQKSMVLVLIGLLVFALGCKEKPVEKPPEPTKPEISVKEIAAITVVYLEKKGPYSETGKAMAELFGFMGKKNLKPRNFPMGVFHDDPEKVASEKTRYEVMSQFVGEFKGDKELKVKELPAQKVAMVLYTGPYEKCMPTYKELFGWIIENKYEPYGPCMEKYLNDPSQVPPEELKTEICVPVKAKTE